MLQELWEEWRDSGSCWHGGLPGAGGLSGASTVKGKMRGSLFLHPLPFSNLIVAAVVSVSHSPWRGQEPRCPCAWAGVCSPCSPIWLSVSCPLLNSASTSDRISEVSDHKTFLLPQTVVFSRRDYGDSVGRNPSIARKGTRP